MPVTNITRIKPIIWIPPSVSSMYKIEIITSSETTDVTGYCKSARFKQAINPDTGTFEITILNPNDKFKDVFSAENKVKLYKDYGSSASVCRFQGIIESIDQSNNKVRLKGKGLAKYLLDYTIVGNYVDQEISTILTDIISKVNKEITDKYTTTKINPTETNITISFNHKSAWECIETLCQLTGFDFYVDENKDCHFFEAKSVENTIDAVVHSFNLLEIEGFSKDVDKVKNKIIINGAVIDTIPILYTIPDPTSIASYGLREEVIIDTSIESDAEAKTRGYAELALKKDPPIVGEVESTLLVGLKPGEMLKVSAPADGIPPNTYKVVEFEDTIENNNIPKTKIKLEKWKPSIPIEFRNLFLKQKETQDITNINKLAFSYLFTFDNPTNIASGSDYSVTEGYLTFTSASGYIQSSAKDTTSNITKFEVRASGENLVGNVTYYISVDNGISGLTTGRSLDTLYEFPGGFSSEGHQLIIKVVTTSASAKISTLCILYST